jgi:hypothetical protein
MIHLTKMPHQVVPIADDHRSSPGGVVVICVMTTDITICDFVGVKVQLAPEKTELKFEITLDVSFESFSPPPQ